MIHRKLIVPPLCWMTHPSTHTNDDNTYQPTIVMFNGSVCGPSSAMFYERVGGPSAMFNSMKCRIRSEGGWAIVCLVRWKSGWHGEASYTYNLWYGVRFFTPANSLAGVYQVQSLKLQLFLIGWSFESKIYTYDDVQCIKKAHFLAFFITSDSGFRVFLSILD